ncbi:MAG TPA: hypothetical protein VH374_13670 [Polyangia bacterium]|nr:hypothetical protein [Polyangia bacterium]
MSIVQVTLVSAGHAPRSCSGGQEVAFGVVTFQCCDEQVANVRQLSPRTSSPQPHASPSFGQAAPLSGG